MTPDRDDGVALVEAAIAGSILFFLLFCVFEFGMAFRDYLTVNDAVEDATRLGAIVGPDVSVSGANADFEMVRTLREGMGSIDPASIERIVVFRGLGSGVDDPLRQIPVACINGTAVVDRCNVYEPGAALVAAQTADTTFFSCVNAGDPACFWDPVSRDDGPDPTTIDYVGLYVRVRHDYITGLFGDSFTIDKATVIRLEPGSVL